MRRVWLRAAAVVVVLGGAALLMYWITSADDLPPVHVAMVGPMTGTNPENGAAILEGAQLFLDEVNRAGGVDGRRVVLDVYDDRNEARAATEAAEQIVSDGRAVAVIGHNYSSCSLAGGEVYQRVEIPAVTPSSTAPSVTATNPWYFRTIFNDKIEGSFLASYITKVFGSTSVAIIHEQGTYGDELAAIMRSNCEGEGVEVAFEWSFSLEDPALANTLQRIVGELRSSGYRGVVFLAVHAPEGIQLVKLLRGTAEMDNTIVAPNGIASLAFQRAFEDLPEEQQSPGYFTNGIYVSCPFLFDSADEDGQQFRSHYMERYEGREPDWRAAFAYDAAAVLVDAIRAAGVTGDRQTLAKDRRAIRDHLATLTTVARAVKGATGFNYFDAKGDSRKPVNLGVFRSRNIISTLTQFQEIVGLRGINDLDREIRRGRILLVDGRPMYRTNVVYTGVQIRSIDNINVGRLTSDVDIDLWFRSQGVPDASDIVFLNAAEPVDLGEPIQSFSEKGIDYRRYRVKATFKMDYLEADSFEQHIVGFSFVHRRSNRNHLIYVTDVLGMAGASAVGDAHEWMLSPGSGWKISDIQYFQDVMARGSEGDPRLLDEGARGFKFSRFSSKVTIERERLALRRSLDREAASSVAVGALVVVLVLLIVGRSRQAQLLSQLSFAFNLAAGIALLLAAEVVLVENLRLRLDRYHLEQITRIFDLLWWIVPALFLIYALEVFVWRPLEQRAEQKIPNIVRRFVGFVILLLTFFAIIAFVYDQKITSLLATSGVIAMIIGLAIQINISNIFSGIALNLERPFRVGDWIKIGSYNEAKVLDMTWRTTRLLLRDNTVLCVPNSIAAESEVVNFNRPEEPYELWITFHADPAHKPERVIKIALDALSSHPAVLHDPKPGCRFIGYTDYSGEYVAVPVLTHYGKRNVERGAIMTHLWNELHRAGIRQAIRTHELLVERGRKDGGARSATPFDIIADVEIFRGMPDDSLRYITDRMEELRIEPGATIVEQGAEGDSLFIVVEGTVAVWVTVASGEVIEVDRMGAGAFFGEMALLTGEARTASIRAVTPSQVFKVTKEHVAPLLEKQPEMVRVLSEALTQRTINRESKKSAYEASQIDKEALFSKFLHKIQSFFGVSGDE